MFIRIEIKITTEMDHQVVLILKKAQKLDYSQSHEMLIGSQTK